MYNFNNGPICNLKEKNAPATNNLKLNWKILQIYAVVSKEISYWSPICIYTKSENKWLICLLCPFKIN